MSLLNYGNHKLTIVHLYYLLKNKLSKYKCYPPKYYANVTITNKIVNGRHFVNHKHHVV